jgi:hypothetical protein
MAGQYHKTGEWQAGTGQESISVLPGGGKSSRLHFSKTTAILGRLTAKFFTRTACFLTFHVHF